MELLVNSFEIELLLFMEGYLEDLMDRKKEATTDTW